MPGLSYRLSFAESIGESFFDFARDSAGNISTAYPAATARRKLLRLKNIGVKINPGSYTGKYKVGASAELSNVTKVILIPSLPFPLVAGTELGRFTPNQKQVNPPTLSTFTFSTYRPGFRCCTVFLSLSGIR